jgi:hypothetical protein
MKRSLAGWIVAALAASLLARASFAEVGVDIHIGIPPPPVVVFPSEPTVVVVPQTRVYYVPEVSEYDMYRFGSFWYVNQGGYWYRSKAYRGPFQFIEYARVPQAIVGVPAGYRHHPRHPHGGPPGHSSHGKHHGHGHDDH